MDYTNFMNTLDNFVKSLNNLVWGWPLIIAFIAVGIITTIALRFIQIRYFAKAWRLMLSPAESSKSAGADMSPIQAFLNALNTSVGNGALAGMATAIFDGGPGAAFWILVVGFFGLPIRFAEVYLSGAFKSDGNAVTSGGPMLYLQKVPGGAILPSIYAVFLLLLAFISGNAIQANSISCGVQALFASANPIIIALAIGLFVAFIMFGGAQRIIKFSQTIVPFKVGIFFIASLIVFIFNLPSLWAALKIIFVSAFTPQAIRGALIGTTLQTAIRFGMSRSLNSSEIGLGTAAVFFGSTGSKNPVENGIMSMVTAFISSYLVSFLLCLLMVMSGIWNSGATGIELTTLAYSSAFGQIAGWLVTILSITFGIGVLVAYAYVGRECWAYLTKGKFLNIYSAIYCALAFFGSIAKVGIVWSAVDIVNAGLIALNLYAIVMLLGMMKKAVESYDNEQRLVNKK